MLRKRSKVKQNKTKQQLFALPDYFCDGSHPLEAVPFV